MICSFGILWGTRAALSSRKMFPQSAGYTTWEPCYRLLKDKAYLSSSIPWWAPLLISSLLQNWAGVPFIQLRADPFPRPIISLHACFHLCSVENGSHWGWAGFFISLTLCSLVLWPYISSYLNSDSSSRLKLQHFGGSEFHLSLPSLHFSFSWFPSLFDLYCIIPASWYIHENHVFQHTVIPDLSLLWQSDVKTNGRPFAQRNWKAAVYY